MGIHRAGLVSRAGYDARDDHGVLRRDADSARRVRKFSDPAHDRGKGHGFSPVKYAFDLDPLRCLEPVACVVIRSGRGGVCRMDWLSAIVGSACVYWQLL